MKNLKNLFKIHVVIHIAWMAICIYLYKFKNYEKDIFLAPIYFFLVPGYVYLMIAWTFDNNNNNNNKKGK